jgi:hypothetical protein
VTTIPQRAIQGDFRFASSDGLTHGVVVGDLVCVQVGRPPAIR